MRLQGSEVIKPFQQTVARILMLMLNRWYDLTWNWRKSRLTIQNKSAVPDLFALLFVEGMYDLNVCLSAQPQQQLELQQLWARNEANVLHHLRALAMLPSINYLGCFLGLVCQSIVITLALLVESAYLCKDEGSSKCMLFHQPILHMSNFIKWSPRIGKNTVILLLF